MAVQWCLMVLICVCLMPNDVEHLFMCSFLLFYVLFSEISTQIFYPFPPMPFFKEQFMTHLKHTYMTYYIQKLVQHSPQSTLEHFIPQKETSCPLAVTPHLPPILPALGNH